MLIDNALLQYGRKNPTDGFLTSYTTNDRGEKVYGANRAEISDYHPSDDVEEMTLMMKDAFRWADVSLRKPRREFNDYSVLTRMMYDQMAWNTYQPNNGNPIQGDPTSSWKSNAVRPIIRNKVMSIAAHVTAKLLYPKIFAYNKQSDEQSKAAQIMRDLVEWASEQNKYEKHSLYAVINALVNPASFVHVEYAEAYRTIKTDKVNGKWNTKEILDEDLSGFKLTQVPVDELYIQNFYEEDIQRQGYLIWRRVQDFATMQAKYGKHPNFKYVKPGMQVVYNDANIGFYEVYDSNLRGELCEEVILYSKPLDLQLTFVNGVIMCDYDEPNPRMDKLYPFIAFGYEPFDEGRSLYKKSLAFKVQPDADIINTLYPMIIDGTYLNIFAPILVAGEQEIGADVMIPGAVTTVENPEATVTPIRAAQDIKQGMETMLKLEDNINEASITDIKFGMRQTAYTTSAQVAQQQLLLGNFVTMVKDYVRQYGRLIVGDIVQHITVPEVDKIVDDGELVYKTIIAHDRQVEGGKRSRKIKFDSSVPDTMDSEEELSKSYDVLQEQGGETTKQEIAKVNPGLFRNLKYMVTASPDFETPLSDDVEKAFGLELHDRAIKDAQMGVPIDMEQVAKDFLFNLYPKASQDVNKYFKKETPGMSMPGIPPMNPQGMPPQQPPQVTPGINSPLQNAGMPGQMQSSPTKAMQNNPLIK